MTRSLSIKLLLLALFCCVGCKHSRHYGDVAELLEPMPLEQRADVPLGQLSAADYRPERPGEYRINAGDVLEIMVMDQADTLVENVPISPDGYLYYMFGKPIRAAGLTVDQLREKLEGSLGEMFRNPEVVLIVKAYSDNTYHILGKVTAPGEYNLKSTTTLREAVAHAGGLSKGMFRGAKINLSEMKNSYVVRDGKKLPVDFSKLFEKGDNKHNIYIRPGDYIYMAAKLQQEVYVLGAVPRPMAIVHEDELSLLKVMASTNFLDTARLKKVIILRGSLDKPQVIQVNLKHLLAGKEKDIYLLAGDIVYVPKKPFQFVKELVQLAIRSYTMTIASDAASYISTEHLFQGDDE